MEKRGLLAIVVVVVFLPWSSADLSDDELFVDEPSLEPILEEPLPEENVIVESPSEDEVFMEETVQNQPELTLPVEEVSIASVQLPLEEKREFSSIDIEKEAGITPESPWWNVEVIFDRMAMALLLNPSELKFRHEQRVSRGLTFAQQRLFEMQIMAEKNNVRGLAKASTEYQNIMHKIQNDVTVLDEYDQEKAAVALLRLDYEVDQHEEILKKTQETITSNTRGGFDEKERALFGSAIAGMQASGQGFHSVFQEKKDRFVIVVGETPLVEDVGAYVPEQPTLDPQPVAPMYPPPSFTAEDVAAAKLKLAEVRSQRDLIFSRAQETGFSIPVDLQQKIDALLQEAQTAYDTQQYGNVRELVGKATVLLELLEEKIVAP